MIGKSLQRKIENLVDRGLNSRSFIGAAVAVRRAREERYFRYYAGYRSPDLSPKVDESTLFDLASLTKTLATTVLILQLVEEGKISLDCELGDIFSHRRVKEPAAEYLDPMSYHAHLELPEPNRSISIKELLTHTAGLPPLPGIHSHFPNHRTINIGKSRDILFSVPANPELRGRVLYSCTGFMLLGEVIRAVSGKDIQELFEERIGAPIFREVYKSGAALAGEPRPIGFKPGPEESPHCVATEYDPWRGSLVRGVVHDENSYCMGGVAGNAGLFGTLNGVAGLVSSLFFPKKEDPLLNIESIDEMGTLQASSPASIEPRPKGPVSPVLRRGYGVELLPPLEGTRWIVGHTGFTGTSFWVDRERKVSLVALTSRLPFGRKETEEKIAVFRNELYDTVFRPDDLREV